MQVSAPASTLIPVRNLKPGPTVFVDTASDTVVRWEGSGDPAGADVQWVPDALLNHPNFRTSISRGNFVQITEEEASTAPTTVPVPGADLAAEAEGIIHRPEVNDIVQMACLGPGTREGASCANQVGIRQSNLATTPPLCESHAHLASTFVPGEDNTWAKVSMGPRVTQSDQPA